MKLKTTMCVLLALILVGSIAVVHGQVSQLVFTKLTESQIKPEYINKAESVMTNLYKSWKEGIFEPASDDFTTEMQQGLSPQLQRRSYEQSLAMFGDFEGMNFVEALTARFLVPPGTIYRFKGKFSKATQQPEIRLVFDGQGKISGMWLKYWQDELQ